LARVFATSGVHQGRLSGSSKAESPPKGFSPAELIP
jgi:hypothetical protein